MKLPWGWCLLTALCLLFAADRQARAGEVITVDKGIAMLEAKIDEDTIMKVAKMEGNITQFEMSTDNIIKLKKAGASEKLIAWMIEEATKEAKLIQSDVAMFLNNARNVSGNVTDQEAEVFRSSRQKVLSHGQKSILVLVAQGLRRETAAKAKNAALGVIYELLTPEYTRPELNEQLKLHLIADDADIRYSAAHAFAVIATQADLDEAFDTILKNHPIYTDGYVMVLAYSRNGNSIPKLIGLMENSDAEVRRVAAFGIGYQHFVQKKIPSLELQNQLIARMQADNETTEVRIACAKALADMGHYTDDILVKVIQAAEQFPQARPSLVLRMADFTDNNFLLLDYLVNDALGETNDPRVVDAANAALRKLTKRNDNTIEQWRNWWRVQRAVFERAHAAQAQAPKDPPAPNPEAPVAPPAPAPVPGPAPTPGPTGQLPAPAPAETVIQPAPVPPAPAPVQEATEDQKKAIMEHLMKATDLRASSDPKDWAAIVEHYRAIVVILQPLGEKHSWNLQFKKDLQFTESYLRGLERMRAKQYPEARAAFDECNKIGFNAQFDGVAKQLKELDRLTAATQP